MNEVIYTLYTLAGSGVLLNVFTDAPNEITYPMIVIGLTGAVIAQWRQSIKDRQEYRQDIKDIKNSFNATIDKHAQIITKTLDAVKDLDRKYEGDHPK